MAKKKIVKSKRKASSTNKQSIQEFADGKNHIAEEAQHARSLESILSRKTKNPLEAESLEDFEDTLASMQLSQMQELAVKAGVFPSGTKLTLKNKLIKAYRQYSQGSNKSIQVTKPIVEPGSKKEQELLKILKR